MRPKSVTRSPAIPGQLQRLLEETPLLNIEHDHLYEDLKEAIREHINPQDFFEELEVRDFVNALWEEKRFQEQATELVNAEVTKIMKELVTARPLSAQMAKRLNLSGDEIPSSVIGLSVYLKELGTNTALLRAQAFVSVGRGYSILDKLVANRTAKRKTAIRDIELRRRRTKKEKKQVEAKRKGPKLANDNRPAAKTSDWDDDF